MTSETPIIPPNATVTAALAQTAAALSASRDMTDSMMVEPLTKYVISINRAPDGSPPRRKTTLALTSVIKKVTPQAAPLFRATLNHSINMIRVLINDPSLEGDELATARAAVAFEQGRLPNNYGAYLPADGVMDSDMANLHIYAHFATIRNGTQKFGEELYAKRFKPGAELRATNGGSDSLVLETHLYPASYGIAFGNFVAIITTDQIRCDLTGLDVKQLWAAERQSGMAAPGTTLVRSELMQGPVLGGGRKN